ncbi:RICIN domain-containing protein [Streptomyces milbemycinicus]|uniref:RICIN domain-containing protein n=1 Tax=Streptomyces milbemycinicus TaxID=476552 RepID=UPI00340B0047
MLTVVTALWVALLAGLGAAETARAATVDPNAWSVLVNRDSGKAVEVENASTADGAKVVQFTDWGGANQQWQLVPRTVDSSRGRAPTMTHELNRDGGQQKTGTDPGFKDAGTPSW